MLPTCWLASVTYTQRQLLLHGLGAGPALQLWLGPACQCLRAVLLLCGWEGVRLSVQLALYVKCLCKASSWCLVLVEDSHWGILPVPKPAGSQWPFPGSLYSETKHSLALALAASYSGLPTEICVYYPLIQRSCSLLIYPIFNTTFTGHLPLVGWS